MYILKLELTAQKRICINANTDHFERKIDHL